MSGVDGAAGQRAPATGRGAEVGYATLDTPVGTLLLAATEVGLVRVAFEVEAGDGVIDELERWAGARARRSPARLAAASREMHEYFAGAREHFDIPLDRRLSRGFRRRALDRLLEIPYGSTASYGQVASAVGNPGAARAVGTACATNPLPVVVPCHRVVRADGSLGEYGGGVAAKRTLLDLEALRAARGGDPG